MVDAEAQAVRLFAAEPYRGHLRILSRLAALGDLAGDGFGTAALAIGWPGVSLRGSLVPRELAPAAHDLVIAALGDDQKGHFQRIDLGRERDLTPPITIQHDPPPEAVGIARDTTIHFRLLDDHSGVDRTRVRILVDGVPVAFATRGVPRSYLVSADIDAGMDRFGVEVRIEAENLSSPRRVMAPFVYRLEFEGTASPEFRRGDVNLDRAVDIYDAVRILFGLFAGVEIVCRDAADANDDGAVILDDAVVLLQHLFRSGGPPPPPGPDCGEDPTADGLDCAATDC